MTMVWLWGPVILQMAIIFGVSSMSDPVAMPPGISYSGGHFIGYVLLSVLVLRALAGARVTGVTWRTVLLAIVISSLYGVSDEFHQRFVPGRTPDVADVAVDCLGACVGTGGVAVASRITRQRRRVPSARG